MISKAFVLGLAGCIFLGFRLEAATPPSSTNVEEREYRHPALYVPGAQRPLGAIEDRALLSQLQQELAGLGVPASSALWDAAANRWGSLFPAEPLIPGTGKGNALRWPDLGFSVQPDDATLERQAWRAFLAYLRRNQEPLRLDLAELGTPRLAVHDQGALVQIFVPRRVDRIPVRDSVIGAVINHGNLVLLGFDKWADVQAVPEAALSIEQARAVVAAHASPFRFREATGKPRLELVPLASGAGLAAGMEYRLAWVVQGTIEGDAGTWEALVDAVSGELLAFEDRNQYANVKRVVGGVYPVSNDQAPPDGVEVPGTPMPFLDVTLPGPTVVTTNTGGAIGCVGASPNTRQLRTALAGPYVRVKDTCGPVREKAETDSELDFDLGSGPGTDCVMPSGHSAGDTHAARTTFYELNRQMECARGYLPGNVWLQSPVVANLNLPLTCDGFWNGSTLNMERDGPQCRNTGEIAGFLDHEWGHGIDNNGVNPNIINPGEDIADIHALLRLQDSCVARGYLKNLQCGGFGDACTACSGLRDLDWARHRCNRPHTVSWVTSGFPLSACDPVAPACPAGNGTCNRERHCEGYPMGESAWDLFARDLQAPPFGFDANTALERATRLFFLGEQLVTSSYQCSPPFGGCPALAFYKQLLAVDDDNGDLSDGTPHMTAIFAAFNRHETACDSPAPVNSGCAGGPTAAPNVTVAAVDQGAELSWNAVAGASRYAIFRAEGVRGCAFGKAKVGETTGLAFSEHGLANGTAYFYTVLPIGSNSSCSGRMSSCAPVTPAPGPNLNTLPPLPIQALGGDQDGILDNCETARLTVRVENNGVAPLTNVRVVSATSPTHPLTVVVTPLPAAIAASLAPCAQASASIDVTPHGMAFNQSFEVTVTITADQIAPSSRSVTFRAVGVETDFVPVATRTYDFDAGLQGWTVTSGTFNRVEAVPGSGNFYLASSSCLDDQCDMVRSPVVRLTPTSTLSLRQRYDTEVPVPAPYDRANVGVFDIAAGSRTPVSPDGGALYDLAPGAPNGVCDTASQAGWSADTDPDCTADAPFQSSTWTASALNPGGVFTGKAAQLSVNYGTDAAVSGWGFNFDDVTLTDFQEAIPDAQACPAPRPGNRRLR